MRIVFMRQLPIADIVAGRRWPAACDSLLVSGAQRRLPDDRSAQPTPFKGATGAVGRPGDPSTTVGAAKLL